MLRYKVKPAEAMPGKTDVIEDVQVADGSSVKFASGVTPANGGNISSISGTVTLDVTALPEVRDHSRIPLLTIGQDRIASGTTFRTAGARSGATVEYDEADGQLVLLQATGTVIVVK